MLVANQLFLLDLGISLGVMGGIRVCSHQGRYVAYLLSFRGTRRRFEEPNGRLLAEEGRN